MTDIAIRVDGLGKYYRIGRRESYKTLRDSLTDLIHAPLRHLSLSARPNSTSNEQPQVDDGHIWALRDVSFEVKRGEVLGVIGRNGAGKTTLLKILSRITEPTEGQAEIRGRVGSLLEVGTGFHPELTGRENIYLNGAILGMKRCEIERRFDEIVAFAEIEKFIDTPVKRYSSGMYVRLAFAVAAHLEPEILLVDEVLAVGDTAFQKKCLGKMGEIGQAGRTVLLVSHNMPSITSLTQRAIWLHEGCLVEDGPSTEIVHHYLSRAWSQAMMQGEVDLTYVPTRLPGHMGEAIFRKVRLTDSAGDTRSAFFEGEPITVEITIESKRQAQSLEVRCYFKTVDGVWLVSSLSGKLPAKVEKGLYQLSTVLTPNPLRPGRYTVELGMQTGAPQDRIAEAISFDIEHDPTGYDDPVLRSNIGLIRVDCPWTDIRPVS